MAFIRTTGWFIWLVLLLSVVAALISLPFMFFIKGYTLSFAFMAFIQGMGFILVSAFLLFNSSKLAQKIVDIISTILGGVVLIPIPTVLIILIIGGLISSFSSFLGFN